jgi:hypothetical protein
MGTDETRTPEHRALLERVEALYDAFAHCPVGDSVPGCPCCVSDEDAKNLARLPLRKLPDALLGRYAFKALSTWGDEADLRHFIPAIWERLVLGRSMIDPQIVYGKLAGLGLDARQASALIAITRGWLVHALVTGGETQTVIECAGLAAMPMAPLIAALDERSAQLDPPSASGLARLAWLLEGRSAFRWIWWKTDQEQLLARWIRTHGRPRLEAAFFAAPDHEDAADWSYAVQLLEIEQP